MSRRTGNKECCGVYEPKCMQSSYKFCLMKEKKTSIFLVQSGAVVEHHKPDGRTHHWSWCEDGSGQNVPQRIETLARRQSIISLWDINIPVTSPILIFRWLIKSENYAHDLRWPVSKNVRQTYMHGCSYRGYVRTKMYVRSARTVGATLGLWGPKLNFLHILRTLCRPHIWNFTQPSWE